MPCRRPDQSRSRPPPSHWVRSRGLLAVPRACGNSPFSTANSLFRDVQIPCSNLAVLQSNNSLECRLMGILRASFNCDPRRIPDIFPVRNRLEKGSRLTGHTASDSANLFFGVLSPGERALVSGCPVRFND